MASLEIDGSGVGPLAAALEAAGHDLTALADVFRAEGAAALAGATIPRRTGHLEASAGVIATDTGFTLTSAAYYAGYVHAVDPFFTREISAREATIMAALTEHADSVLSTVGD